MRNINITGSAALDDKESDYKGTAGIKADQAFEMNGGTLGITSWGTGSKGISGDNTACFNGGTVIINTIGEGYGSYPVAPAYLRECSQLVLM